MTSQSLRHEAIEPLLDIATQDPESEVRIAAFDVCTRLPLNKKAWRAVADAADQLLDEFLPGSAERHTIIKLSVRIPLLSFRRRLREMAASEDEEDRLFVIESLAAAADPSQIRWVLEQLRNGHNKWFETLAAMPIDKPIDGERIEAGDIPVVSAQEGIDYNDPFLWRALALLRLGEIEPLLEHTFSGEENQPLFWGNPWSSYNRIAAVRPFPESLGREMLDEYENNPELKASRTFTIILGAITGAYDAEGSPLVVKESDEFHDAASEGSDKPDQPQGEPASLPDDFSIDEIDPMLLSRLPAEHVPKVALEILNQGSRKATELAEELPVREIVGNRVIELVAALPSVPDWPVVGLVRSWLDAQTSALDDEQFAWVIARANPDHAVGELSRLLGGCSLADCLRILELMGLVADVYSGRAGSPYRGAGPGGEPASHVQELIDDQMPEAPPPSEPHAGKDVETRVIRSGFASEAEPAKPLSRYLPLKTGTNYFFWFDEGPSDEEFAIDTVPVEKPKLAAGVALRIILFFDPGQLEPVDNAFYGDLIVLADGSWAVVRQPRIFPDDWPGKSSRLYFPIRVPDEPGNYTMRCSLHHGATLLKSWRVTVKAVDEIPAAKLAVPQLRSDIVDYAITNNPSFANIEMLKPHGLSLAIDEDEKHSTHRIYAVGEGDSDRFSLNLDSADLANFVNNARRELDAITVTLDEKGELIYRYESKNTDLKKLTADLRKLARIGYLYYNALTDDLSNDELTRLEALVAKPGMIQVAHTRSARQMLPAALVYDYPLWTTVDASQLNICPTFKEAFNNGVENLSEVSCFQGHCPSKGNPNLVCPSGFWGYRHQLGMPLSIEGQTAEVPIFLCKQKPVRFGAGFAKDLQSWSEHSKKLRDWVGKNNWSEASNWAQLDPLLRDPPHIVYFFCHGEIEAGSSATRLVFGNSNSYFDSTSLRTSRITWTITRPLIFINGCHTTDLTPWKSLELVTPFIVRAGGAGVIGTEVTIYETLATSFAEECMHSFITRNMTIGEAVRQARLKVLSDGNPLGLVYIAFVYGGLTLFDA